MQSSEHNTNSPAPARDSQIVPPDKALVSLPNPRAIGSILFAILIVSGLAELAYGIVNFSAMPVYALAIHLPTHWVGEIAAAYLVTEGLLKSPFGALSDRIGRKFLMVIGPGVSVFTALLTPHIHNPLLLMALRALDGMGLAALWPAAFSMIGDYVPSERRASAMSLFNVAYLVGLALGPAIGGGSNDAAEFFFHLPSERAKQASFYVAAILFAVTVVLALVLLPGGRVTAQEMAQTGLKAKTSPFLDFRRMLGRMPALLLIVFVTFLGVGLIMAYAKLFVSDLFHMKESEFGGLLIVPALIIAAASVPLGTLGDRIGKPQAAKIGMGICVVSYWLLVLFPSKPSLIALGSLIGIGFVIAFPALMALVSDVCDSKQRGAAVGAVGTAQGLGAIVGVLSSGYLYELTISHLGPISIPPHGLPFLLCAVMLAVAFLLALFGLKSPAKV